MIYHEWRKTHYSFFKRSETCLLHRKSKKTGNTDIGINTVNNGLGLCPSHWLPLCSCHLQLALFLTGPEVTCVHGIKSPCFGNQSQKWLHLGTSLVVQWLGLCPSNAGALGSIPHAATKSSHVATKDLSCHSEDGKFWGLQVRPSTAK